MDPRYGCGIYCVAGDNISSEVSPIVPFDCLCSRLNFEDQFNSL